MKPPPQSHVRVQEFKRRYIQHLSNPMLCPRPLIADMAKDGAERFLMERIAEDLERHKNVDKGTQ